MPIKLELYLNSVHEITDGHCPARFHVWLSGFAFCRSQWPACFQISIAYHIQKTSTHFQWPAWSADCRTLCPTVSTSCRSLAIHAGLLYMIYYWNLKTCWSLWPTENKSCRSHMKLCWTVNNDWWLFHALSGGLYSGFYGIRFQCRLCYWFELIKIGL